MKLSEKREMWEEGAIEVFEFHSPPNTQLVMAKFQFDSEIPPIYNLLRYFPIGEDWEVSVEFESYDIEDCLRAIKCQK